MSERFQILLRKQVVLLLARCGPKGEVARPSHSPIEVVVATTSPFVRARGSTDTDPWLLVRHRAVPVERIETMEQVVGVRVRAALPDRDPGGVLDAGHGQ